MGEGLKLESVLTHQLRSKTKLNAIFCNSA